MSLSSLLRMASPGFTLPESSSIINCPILSSGVIDAITESTHGLCAEVSSSGNNTISPVDCFGIVQNTNSNINGMNISVLRIIFFTIIPVCKYCGKPTITHPQKKCPKFLFTKIRGKS